MWNTTWVDILKHDLLENYDKRNRPSGINKPVNVTLDLTITHVDVHEETGFLNFWGWMSFVGFYYFFFLLILLKK